MLQYQKLFTKGTKQVRARASQEVPKILTLETSDTRNIREPLELPTVKDCAVLESADFSCVLFIYCVHYEIGRPTPTSQHKTIHTKTAKPETKMVQTLNFAGQGTIYSSRSLLRLGIKIVRIFSNYIRNRIRLKRFRSVRIRVRIFNIRYRIRIRILKLYICDVDIQLYLIRHDWHYPYSNLTRNMKINMISYLSVSDQFSS